MLTLCSGRLPNYFCVSHHTHIESLFVEAIEGVITLSPCNRITESAKNDSYICRMKEARENVVYEWKQDDWPILYRKYKSYIRLT